MKQLLILSSILLVTAIGHAQNKGGSRLNNPWIYEAMDKGIKDQKIFVQFIVEPSGRVPADSVKALNTFHGLEKVAEKGVIEGPVSQYGIKPSDKTQKLVVPIRFKFDDFTSKEWSEFHKIKAQKMLAKGDMKGAKRELEESIKLNKQNGESYYMLGELWSKDDKTKSDQYFELAKKNGYQK